MMKMKGLVCGLILIGIWGCGGATGKTKPDTVNVSGTVYYKNAPLPNAEVNFVAADGSFAAFGMTDSNGKYTLVQGAVPGMNKVYISKKEGEEINVDPESGMDSGQFEASQVGTPGGAKQPTGPIQLIPPEYSDPGKTKLSFDVPAEGTESADFRF